MGFKFLERQQMAYKYKKTCADCLYHICSSTCNEDYVGCNGICSLKRKNRQKVCYGLICKNFKLDKINYFN